MSRSRSTSSISSKSSKSSKSSGKDSLVGEDAIMERGAWGNKVEFVLTVIGFAVGLGNVWRFPYLLFQSGGGAFLIPFIIMLVLIGIPIFFMELNFGQFASLGPLAIWRVSPIMKGLGFSMIFTNLTVAVYYNVIIGWCIYYLFASFTDHLPWEDCQNPWNTPYCTTMDEFGNLTANNITNVTLTNNQTVGRDQLKTPSEEYYYRKVLQMSDGLSNPGTIVWQLALCLFLSYVIVLLVLIRGIGSLGKVVYFSSTFPYLLLTIMLVRGVTLEGAALGIEFYMIPDWSKLGEAKVWSDAAIQIFYALSACTGGLIAMSSYNNFKNNTLRDSLLVPIINVLTSIYAGFVIFSVLGYMATKKGVPVADVAADGPGLVFVVYPEGLSTMPGAPVWSVLFFIMMMMLGLSSMFSMIETFFVAFMDEYPNTLRKTYLRTVILRCTGVLLFYLISLPMVTNCGFYLFSLVDKYTGSFPLLVIGLIETLTIMYIYGYKNFAEDVRMMLGKNPNIWFRICWMAISPIVIVLAIVATGISYKAPTLFNNSYVYPAYGEAIGWCIVAFCIIFIPAVFLYVLFKDKDWKHNGLFKTIVAKSKPEPEWGPAEKVNRTGKYAPIGQDDDGHLDGHLGGHLGEINHVMSNGGSKVDEDKTNGFKVEVGAWPVENENF